MWSLLAVFWFFLGVRCLVVEDATLSILSSRDLQYVDISRPGPEQPETTEESETTVPDFQPLWDTPVLAASEVENNSILSILSDIVGLTSSTTLSPEEPLNSQGTTETAVEGLEATTNNIGISEGVSNTSPATLEANSFRTSTTKVNSQFFSNENTGDCESLEVQLRSSLDLGATLDREGNLTWTNELLENSQCVSEYVVMFRFTNGSAATAAVLCPGYKVGHAEGVYWCEYDLPEHFCNQQIEILLEIWTFNNDMLQPKSEVRVLCDQSLEANVQASQSKITQSHEEVYRSTGSSLIEDIFPTEVTAVRVSLDLVRLPTENGSICSWSSWSSWGSCSLTCGGRGTRTRDRTQIGSQICSEKETENQDCITNLCSTDCKWSPWGEWSQCSTSCGKGTRKRLRQVAEEATHWGRRCGEEAEETEECIEDTCPVDGKWSGWSRWGYCSRTCGIGSRSRTRSCTEPETQFGGAPCDGASLESTQCYRIDCPAVDGGWSPWGRWTSCNSTCGKGEQKRYRSCTIPMPSGGGRMCTGDSVETNSCILKRCSDDTSSSSTDLLRTNFEDRRAVYSSQRINKRRPTQDKDTNIIEKTRFKNRESLKEEQEQEEATSNRCKAVDYVYGYGDPELLGTSGVLYTCNKGLVVDTRSNRRFYGAQCDQHGHVNTTNLPSCVPATHCVGPVHKPGGEEDAYLPLPWRDAPVNTPIRYACGNSESVYGSCFFDGRYRQPSPVCSRQLHSLCSKNDTDQMRLLTLDPEAYGWLSMEGYPALGPLHPCSWNLTAPAGYHLAISLEDYRSENNIDESWIEVEDLTNQILLKLNRGYMKSTIFTQHNSVLIRLLPAEVQSTFRISYLVLR